MGVYNCSAVIIKILKGGVQKMKRMKVFALLLALVMAFSTAFTGCSRKQEQGSNTQTPAGNVDQNCYLNLPIDDDVTTFDTSKMVDGYSSDVAWETQEGLTREVIGDDGVEKIEPAGAEKWDISSDGTVWTFHLRDYKWSDGKPVTAQDYVYAWTRLLDPKTASEYAYFGYMIKNAKAFNEGKAKAEDLGVKALDEKTFQVTLEKPTPYFEKVTPFRSLFPLRQDIVEKYGDKYGTDPSQLVYCGPFVISEWIRGQKIILKKNENYWDAKNVKLSQVTFMIVKEEAPRMQMLEAGQLDAGGARGEYLNHFNDLANQGKMVVVKKKMPATSYQFFNCQDKVFKNAKVRLAFSLAFDRDGFINTVYKGRHIPAYGWCPYAISIAGKEFRIVAPEPLKDAIKNYPDPKALLIEGLEEVGADPDPSKLEVHYITSGTDAFTRQFDEFFIQQWESKLGVKIKYDAVNDFAQYQDKVNQMDFQVGGMSWLGDYNDPMTFFDMFTTGNENNNGKWSNAEYDKLIEDIGNEKDANKRLEMYQKAEKILLIDDCAIMPIFYRQNNTFVHNYVKKIMQPSFGPDWECKYAYTEGRK